ncbi:MAG TPA: 50S ribosomal protein L9 [Firmicutes bacterium]|nr:50S ribosomal protein L9 [Bacillota bacterium]
MKVLMRKDLRKVGKAGDVIDVSDGYGANYLIPNGYAVQYTKEAVKMREKELLEAAKEKALKIAEAEKIAAQLQGITFKFQASVGNRGAMIGTISIKELKKALREQLNISVDKEDFPEHNMINAFGLSHVKVELYKGVFGTMNVLVEPKPSEKK